MKEGSSLVSSKPTASSHFHWVAVVCFFAGITLLAFLACWFRRCRHGGRYQYTALEVENSSQGERVELERKAREHALKICQQYLITNPRYELIHHLNDIGSRVDKQWFVVKDSSVKTERLLTLVPKGQCCPIDCNQDTREIILELFRTLQHPYIYPVLDLEFTETADDIYAVLVMPFNSKGSLKDLIYRSSWQNDWTLKYGERGDGLPLSQVQRLGRQILEALLFLKDRGFPPYGHLHSGNIILQNGVARLAGLENTLLGFTSRIHPVVWTRARVVPAAVDTICFGHVLFEMTAGYELTIPQPTQGHLQLDLERYPQVVEVLELIFQHPDGRYPTIEELLLCDLFRNIDLREMRGSSVPVFHHRLASPTKALLAEIKRAQFGTRPRRTLSASTSDCSTPPPRERREETASSSEMDTQTTSGTNNTNTTASATINSEQTIQQNTDDEILTVNDSRLNQKTFADDIDSIFTTAPEKHRNLLLHTNMYHDECCSITSSDTQCLIR
ncbi:slowpoke-binding protein isoform X2 [Chrysoperla carnea]|uniref:slowpoke-binding protein isoform X2 n=1 Tax=Chrysoperla carnea TaxID=189513 RepID=UPI001D069A88|nr:slowpoke-binding protein isoform X2 [Chrysoperla carnea]